MITSVGVAAVGRTIIVGADLEAAGEVGAIAVLAAFGEADAAHAQAVVEAIAVVFADRSELARLDMFTTVGIGEIRIIDDVVVVVDAHVAGFKLIEVEGACGSSEGDDDQKWDQSSCRGKGVDDIHTFSALRKVRRYNSVGRCFAVKKLPMRAHGNCNTVQNCFATIVTRDKSGRSTPYQCSNRS